MICEHAWQRLASPHRTHFVDEPNSKRRSRTVSPMICIACGQRGFTYPPSRVLYTWRRDPEHWLADTTLGAPAGPK